MLLSSVQNYGWGDPTFIPELQRRRPTGEPEAELWMGAHPKAPSILRRSSVGLDVHIADDPATALGTAERFGELPFLKKILAAAQPLSIQTHPDASRAAEGFERENEAGIPLDSPTRTYRDPNHKPELICALTPFHAKCGFRPVVETSELFATLACNEIAPLTDRLAAHGDDADVLAELLQWLLGNQPDAAAELSNAVVRAAATVGDSPWNTEIEWSQRLQSLYPGDPGVVVALLLNHFVLAPGEALFLDAGVLHAYVEGAGVEIMANSDNVIRGGLTPKHVDIAELAEVVDTKPIDPPVQRPLTQEHTYDTPVDEFSLTRLVLDEGGYEATVHGPEILIASDGRFQLDAGHDQVTIDPGTPVWIDAVDGSWTAEGHGTLFRASVPATSPG